MSKQSIIETAPPTPSDKQVGQHCLVRLWREGNTETGYGEPGIILDEDSQNGAGALISMRVMDDGNIELREECDGYFTRTESPENAIAIFREAIKWIEVNTKEQPPTE